MLLGSTQKLTKGDAQFEAFYSATLGFANVLVATLLKAVLRSRSYVSFSWDGKQLGLDPDKNAP